MIRKNLRSAIPSARTLSPSFVPAVIIHGRNDELVSITESYRLVSRLKEAEIIHRLIKLKDGAHGFGRQREFRTIC